MTSPTWRWVSEAVVLAIHDEQIAQHGVGAGVRDMALVQSALARPENLDAYGEPDAAALAAAHAFGIAHNPGFIDGNKRTAFVVANVFLLDHGHDLTASDTDAVTTTVSLTAGEIDEAGFADGIRNALGPIDSVI